MHGQQAWLSHVRIWVSAGVEAAELADAALACAPPEGTLLQERAACALAAYSALSQHAAMNQQDGACEALVAMLHGVASFDEGDVSTCVVVCTQLFHFMHCNFPSPK